MSDNLIAAQGWEQWAILGLFLVTSLPLILIQRCAAKKSYLYLRLLYLIHGNHRHTESAECLSVFILYTHFMACYLYISPLMLYPWCCLSIGLLLSCPKVLRLLDLCIGRHRAVATIISLALMLPAIRHTWLLAPVLTIDILCTLSCFIMEEDKFTEFQTKYPLLSNDSKPDGKRQRPSGLWQRVLHEALLTHRQTPDENETDAS